MANIDDVLAVLTSLSKADKIPAFLGRLSTHYGLKTVAYLGTGLRDHRNGQREPYLAVTYRPDWVERYRVQGYVKIDPVIQIGLRRLLPLDWDNLPQENKALRRFFGEATEFGLGRKGMSFPVYGCSGERAILSVTADMTEREWQWARRTVFRDFSIIASHLHDAILRTEGVLRVRPHLSSREIECLQWTSEGKTAWECGMILGLSQHTVRCYLESARHKLVASSNTHAVSLALKSGLLNDLP